MNTGPGERGGGRVLTSRVWQSPPPPLYHTSIALRPRKFEGSLSYVEALYQMDWLWSYCIVVHTSTSSANLLLWPLTLILNGTTEAFAALLLTHYWWHQWINFLPCPCLIERGGGGGTLTQMLFRVGAIYWMQLLLHPLCMCPMFGKEALINILNTV